MENQQIIPRGKKVAAAARAAFPHTLPILCGFLFLGISYGIYARAAGLSFLYPLCMSILIFGGSLEFVAVSLLTAPFSPLSTFLLALMIQARHLFYGIAMLEKYKGTGIKKLYLIFGMCDESFSVNCAVTPPPHVDRGWFMFFVTLFNQSYWVAGATLGGLLGSFFPFPTEGLDFVMTAMFTVIFLENWLKEKRHLPSLFGVLGSVFCLLVFGADSFLIPAMVTILLLLTVFFRPLSAGREET